MESDQNSLSNLQYKVALSRTKFAAKIEKQLKKKNAIELKKISNLQFEEWEECKVEVPQLRAPDVTQIPVLENQNMEQIKTKVLEQLKLIKIIERRRNNPIAKLVDEL